MKMLIYVVCGILWLPLMQLNAAITLAGKQCGTKICHIMEFCSTFNNQCEHCDLVCNASAHNYDQVICTTQCQDYLHESRYGQTSNFAADIEQLKHQQTIILIVVLISLLLFVCVHGCHLVRWLRKRDYLTFGSLKRFGASKKKQIHPTEITVANPHTQSPKLTIRKMNHNGGGTGGPVNSAFSISGMEGSTVQTVSTPVSTRIPAEDNTLDYTYDNAALQVTPVGDKPKSERPF